MGAVDHSRRASMKLRTFSIVICTVAIGLPTLLAETQILMRGQVHTDAEAAEMLKRMAAEFDSKEEWQSRAESIRAGVLRGMRLEHVPEPCPLKPIRHSVRQEDGYT